MIYVEDTPFEPPHPHLMGVWHAPEAHVVKEVEEEVAEPKEVVAKVVAPRRGRPPKNTQGAETK